MKKYFALAVLCSLSSVSFAADLIHPMDFNGTEAEKKRVVSQITASVKETYTSIGMGDPYTLRMMEKEELRSFKALTQVTNRKLLDSVIRQYCNIGMCNYNTILMMYNEQNSAASRKLTW